MEVGHKELSGGATAFERATKTALVTQNDQQGMARCDRAGHQRGMVSAEWAVGIIAAVAIAGVLLAVVTTGQVKAALLHVILTVIATFASFAK